MVPPGLKLHEPNIIGVRGLLGQLVHVSAKGGLFLSIYLPEKALNIQGSERAVSLSIALGMHLQYPEYQRWTSPSSLPPLGLTPLWESPEQ